MTPIWRRATMVVALALAATLVSPLVADGNEPPETRMGKIAVDWPLEARTAGQPHWRISEPLPAGDAALVGARWDGSGLLAAELRVRRDGRWEPWLELEPLGEDDGPDPATAEAEGSLSGTATDPVWVGRVERLQVRVRGTGDLPRMTLHTVELDGDDSLAFDPDAPVPGAAAAASRPSVVMRSSWDPNNDCRPRTNPSYASNVRFTVIHHTAGSNSYTSSQSANIVRSVCLYHRNTLGWSDIGYNIVVDRFGKVFEGRAGGLNKAVIGAHAANYNTGSTGVSVLGCFHPSGCSGDTTIPWAAVDAVDRVVAWKFHIHGVDPLGTTTANSRTIPTIVGHRDVGSTACPGDDFYTFVRGSKPMRGRVAAHMRATKTAPVVGRGNRWLMRNSLSGGNAEIRFRWGLVRDVKVVGDWNRNGQTGPGLFRDGTWLLRNSNSRGTADLRFDFGRGGDVPVVGDWNGDRRTTVGVRRGNRWILRNTNAPGAPDHAFRWGRATDIPVVGDWNGNGRMTPGFVRGNTWHLRNSLGRGPADVVFTYGRAGDVPLVGDWNGNGRMTPGVVRGDRWLLRNSLSGGSAHISFRFGQSGDTKHVRR